MVFEKPVDDTVGDRLDGHRCVAPTAVACLIR
jgi:hypothetical protein